MSRNNLKYNASAPGLLDLAEVHFDNQFVRSLPADQVTDNVPRAVHNACYTFVDPTPVRAPRLLAWADPVGEMLGISRPDSPVGPAAEVLGGNRILPGMQPYAARYGGHQFGHWAGQLGDGRAITLGEVLGPDGVSGSCNSRAREKRLIRALPTAVQCCVRPCASSCAAKRCIIWACRPRVH